MKKKTIFLISIVMAGLATLLFYQYTNQLSQQSGQMKSVVAAAVPIKKDQQITAKMLKKINIPAKSVNADAVQDASGIIGQYSADDIATDEVILKHHLQSLEAATTIAGKLKSDDRAVTIPGGKIETVANMIKPEDTIDIVYTGPSLDGDTTKRADTMVLQENVRVLAVGKQMKTTDASVEYDSITVEVQQKDAVNLIKAARKGVLNYVLHSKMKTAETKVEGS
ncbi:Flp pilus assembly protein CpaB [Ectobacillus sp. sgz5001026]|uniref:Flp pilus assembly protein CpaB n=1 Tax=Ectobacillus sp. sgz5001026 TaxID=3242473 RepID=UPI0036D345B9